MLKIFGALSLYNKKSECISEDALGLFAPLYSIFYILTKCACIVIMMLRIFVLSRCAKARKRFEYYTHLSARERGALKYYCGRKGKFIMKKLLALLLAVVMVVGVTACGKSETKDNDTNTTQTEQTQNLPSENEEAEKEPEAAPQEDKKEEEKPAEKPTEKPSEEKPAEKPQETPQETPKTVGNQLLSVFKSNANGSALDVANAIVEKGNLPFAAGAMEVTPGFLAGFDNAEITGFKSGASFGPMIGSIAFIGYVFELEDGVSAKDFIKNLKDSANLRWNICVEAEEMVTGTAGNKVFFVMCPKQFEE